MAFSVPINLSLGTYVTDGYRTGPQYPGVKNPYNGVTIQNGAVLANYPSASNTNTNPFAVLDFNKFGPGTLMSPIYTFSMYPYATIDGNVANAQAVVIGVGTTWTDLTLAPLPGSPTPNAAVVRTATPSGVPYLQLDWPRCVSVTVAGASMASAAKVTIFGEDEYGQLMQHTITDITTVGTYGLNISGNRPTKAFYKITRVSCSQATGGGGTIAVQTTNIFGLPYVMKSPSDMVKWGWNGKDMLNQSGLSGHLAGGPPATIEVVTPANGVGDGSYRIVFSRGLLIGTAGHLSIQSQESGGFILASTALETSQLNWLIVNGGENLVKPGDPTIPAVGNSAGAFITGDPRGLLQLPEDGAPWGPSPNGVLENVFTYYIEGADQGNNQLAAGQQPYGTTQGTTYPYLNFVDLYGLPQYYTGIPAV